MTGVLAGCLFACASIPTPTERRTHADTLATASGWQAMMITTRQFDLFAYVPSQIVPEQHLTLYIEGDGLAWLSPSLASSDPTPRNPQALRLALAQPTGNAAYLARPCQYVLAEQPGCAQRYWTQARFSPEVIAATDEAIDKLKANFGASHLTLVGYSGGAAVAALVAAHRADVVQLVTVAGNLDHRAWTRHHHLDPLTDSLNPADVAESLAKLPQRHFLGAQDAVIPPPLAKQWPDAFLGSQHEKLQVIHGYTHDCCWAENWSQLFKQ